MAAVTSHADEEMQKESIRHVINDWNEATADGYERNSNLYQLQSLALECTTPTRSSRYKRNPTIDFNDRHWSFAPYESLPPTHIVKIRNKWESKIHPEGQPYYFCSEPANKFRYLTEANIQKPLIGDQVDVLIARIEEEQSLHFESHLESSGPTESSSGSQHGDVDVLLEMDGTTWKYYIVHHRRRGIFWLHDYDATWMADTIGGVQSKAHLRQYLQLEYWQHVEYFPHNVTVQDETVKELIGMLAYNTVGSMTADHDSTVTMNAVEMKEFSELIRTMSELRKDGPPNEYFNGYFAATVARILVLFGKERFAHFYGQPGARLSRLQRVRPSDPKDTRRTLMFKALSNLLFRAPETHWNGIQDVWVDNTVVQGPWDTFIEKLRREWETFVLYATVVMNANVAFLAVPNITVGQNASAGPAQLASQVSMITSVGCIIIGLLLIRQHRQREDTADDAADYMAKHSRHRRGLETLAILYSLPYALLMWGMVTFLIAIAISCFKVKGIAQPTVAGVVWFCVLSLIAWTIITGWEKSKQKETERAIDEAIRNSSRRPARTPFSLLDRLRDVLHGRRRQPPHNIV